MEKNAGDEAISVEDEHPALVSSLPLELAFAPLRLRLFRGIWTPENSLPCITNIHRFFRPRPTDILLVSYPKCGTTWLKALAFTTVTRNRHSLDVSHPLQTLNPHECMPLLDWDFTDPGKLAEINAMDDHEPRLLSTHLPFTLLPHSVKNSSAGRLVCICRDPKDALISLRHFIWKMRVKAQVESEAIPFGKFFEMFCQGICPYGSIWEHVLGYWNESLRAPGRAMFLKYEELLKNPVVELLRLAEFMGCGFSEEEVAARVPEEIVSLCSFDSLKDLGIKQNREISLSQHMKTESFYRKGVAGDWRDYLTPEMEETMDRITQEKLQGITI